MPQSPETKIRLKLLTSWESNSRGENTGTPNANPFYPNRKQEIKLFIFVLQQMYSIVIKQA